MKVILSGCTGFIGGEILYQAIGHPTIRSILCLTRKALPESITSNPKVKSIVLDNFETYPPDVLSQLEDAECCIWALGTPSFKHPSLEACRKGEVKYTLTAAQTFSKYLGPSLKERGKRFRFVFLSGMFANREIDKKLWLLHDARTIKGEIENGLLAIQQQENSNLEISIVRPGGVLPKSTPIPDLLVGVTMSIKVDELAAAMIDEVVGDVGETRTLECAALKSKGRALLRLQ